MSKQLSKIQTTCPIYDKIVKEVEYIKNTLDEETYNSIKGELDLILYYADEIRNIAGDLRDTASDIADDKNKEIEELQSQLEDLEKDKNYQIEKLEDRIYELENQ